MEEKNTQNMTLNILNGETTEEELLAITTALSLYYKGGCEERVLTIKHSSSSDWNSKEFGINQLNK